MRRLEIQVGVAYGTDMEKVRKILEECARNHKEVLDNPPPYVWFREFGDSSIDFRLLFFYPRYDGGLTVRSEVAASIVKAFKENNITIPFQQMDVHIQEALKKEDKRISNKD
jgi:small-conductance mechanosensitive channel